MVSTIITTTVIHAMTLKVRELTWSPMSSRSFVSSSMKISTNGSTMPFTTCDTAITWMSGRCGTRSTPAPSTMSAV